MQNDNSDLARPLCVVADVGGTQIRLAALGKQDAQIRCIAVYRCAEFAQLGAAIDHYLTAQGLQSSGLARLGLALPGAVHQETITLVNSPWNVSRRELETHFACPVDIINDFTAQALAIPALRPGDICWLRAPETGAAADSGPLTRAIIGPGTGLGVAALLPEGGIVESEGGHLSWAPVDAGQQRLQEVLWRWFPRISLERLLSGPGLANLYRAKQTLAGIDHQLSPEHITAGATAGDTACRETVREFVRIFGAACGDLALALGATGGVFLSGGLTRKLGTLFDAELFMAEFDRKGRYSDYCRAIPIGQVVCAYPGLLGIARHMQRRSPPVKPHEPS